MNPLISEEYKVIQSLHTWGEKSLLYKACSVRAPLLDNKYGYVYPTHGELSLIQMKHHLDATLCRFYFCRVILRSTLQK